MAPAPVFPFPVVQWVSAPEVLAVDNDVALVLALCPTVVPIAFNDDKYCETTSGALDDDPL